jgi:pSer/pThr/pTyr-binding forkhead associated (FHA) protein
MVHQNQNAEQLHNTSTNPVLSEAMAEDSDSNIVKTSLDQDATQPGRPVALEVISGSDQGKRHLVRGGRAVVGRSDSCDMQLYDGSVSRRHFEIVIGPSGIFLRDLGSGNGTSINGKKKVEGVVRHQDIICVGDTQIQVVDEIIRQEEEHKRLEEEQRLREEEKRLEQEAASLNQVQANDSAISSDNPVSKNKKGKGKTFVVLTIVILLPILIYWYSRSPQVQVQITNRNAERAALIKEGEVLLSKRNFRAAIEQFQEAQQIEKHADLEKKIENCRKQIFADTQVEAARASASLGELDEAIKKAMQVPLDTDATKEAEKLVSEWTQLKIESIKRSIRSSIKSNDLENARALVNLIPEDQQNELLLEIKKAEKQIKISKVWEERLQKAAEKRRDQEKLDIAKQEIESVIAPVVSKLDNLNFDGALYECERIMENASDPEIREKVEHLSDDIPSLKKEYEEGISWSKKRAYKLATKPLLRALEIYENLEIPSGKLHGLIRQNIVQCLENQGRAAAAKMEHGEAAQFFAQALRIDPKSKVSINGLKAARQHAETIFNEARTLMNRAPADSYRRFEEVVRLTSRRSRLHKLAKKFMSQLEHARPR